MEIQTREKGTIDRRLRGSVGMLADANPARLSKRSQCCKGTTLRDVYNVKDPSRSLILISEDSPGGELYHNH